MFLIRISAHSLWQRAGQEVLNEQLESGSFSQRLEVSLAKGSTNIHETDQGEQGREEPYVWCQVLPLTFSITKPELAVSTTRQCAQWPVALAIILPSSLRRDFCWAAKKHIGNGTARKPGFLLPILHTPCEKEVCLKSSPALKNRNGHGTSHCSLNWDWILTFFEWDQTSSLEHFWALDLRSFLFRNTTFWFASLGPLRSLQIKPDLWLYPLPCWAALISEPWVYQREATLLPATERCCHQDNTMQGNFVKALIWNVLFQVFLFAFMSICFLQKLLYKT